MATARDIFRGLFPRPLGRVSSSGSPPRDGGGEDAEKPRLRISARGRNVIGVRGTNLAGERLVARFVRAAASL